MNKGFIFVTGLAVGGAGAWFATKEYYKSFMEDEFNKLKAYYDEKLYNMKDATSEEDEIMPEPIEKGTTKSVRIERVAKPDAEVEPDYDEIIEKLNYNQYSTSVNSAKPEIITLNEYNEDNSYDKKILSYFPEDETLMDSETEEVMDNVNKVIGLENLEVLSLNSEHNEIYVRNETYGCDYQIILEHGSYADYINEDF